MSNSDMGARSASAVPDPLTAVLVAGGLGTRLRNVSGDSLPKALVPVAGRAVGVRMLELFAREGIRRVAVTTGHLAAQLREGLLPEAERLGIEIMFLEEPTRLGTAGSLPNLRVFFGSSAAFVIAYADIVADMDLRRLVAFHGSRRADLTVVCHPNDHPSDSDLIVVEEDGRVVAVHPRKQPRPEGLPNLVPAAVYCASPSVLGWIEQGAPQDLVVDVLPRMVAGGGRVFGYRTSEYLKDVGTEHRYSMVARDVAAGLPAELRLSVQRPAVFFDRDGVLNEELGGLGLSRREQFTPIPSAGEAVRMVNDAGWLAVVTTNQPQIARGLLGMGELAAVHAKLETWLGATGAHLDRIYYCPHHPERGFEGEIPELKIECECRKPQPGMILRAARELPIDLGTSCVIGDSWRDVAAARAAGVWAYGVRTGVGCRDCGTKWRPDAMFEDVADAVVFLRNGLPASEPLAERVKTLAVAGNRLRVIGVSGPARAGKSVLAHGLIRALKEQHIEALHVRLDDWIVPRSQRSSSMTSEDRCRTGLYRELLRRLVDGEIVSVAAYEPLTREAGALVSYRLDQARIVVLDGLWACHESLRPSLDLAVWVHTQEELLHGRLRSFGGWKGDDEASAEKAHLLFREEFKEVAVQRSRADFVYGAMTARLQS